MKTRLTLNFYDSSSKSQLVSCLRDTCIAHGLNEVTPVITEQPDPTPTPIDEAALPAQQSARFMRVKLELRAVAPETEGKAFDRSAALGIVPNTLCGLFNFLSSRYRNLGEAEHHRKKAAWSALRWSGSDSFSTFYSKAEAALQDIAPRLCPTESSFKEHLRHKLVQCINPSSAPELRQVLSDVLSHSPEHALGSPQYLLERVCSVLARYMQSLNVNDSEHKSITSKFSTKTEAQIFGCVHEVEVDTMYSEFRNKHGNSSRPTKGKGKNSNGKGKGKNRDTSSGGHNSGKSRDSKGGDRSSNNNWCKRCADFLNIDKNPRNKYRCRHSPKDCRFKEVKKDGDKSKDSKDKQGGKKKEHQGS